MTAQLHDSSDRSMRKDANAGRLVSDMAAEHQEWLDGQPTSTSCFFCDWTTDGTAAECREAARAHREKKHPGAANRLGRRRAQSKPKHQRTEAENEQAGREAVEARRGRAEREDAALVAKVEASRQREALAAMDAGEPQPLAHLEDEPRSASSATDDIEGNPMTDSNGRAPRGILQRQILGALLAGNTTPAAIGQAVGRDAKLVSATLTTIVGKGFAAKVGYGVYGPTAEGERAYASGRPLDVRHSGREPQASAEGPGPSQVTASTPPAPAGEEPSRPEKPLHPAPLEPAADDEEEPASDVPASDEVAKPAAAIAIPALRDPIRTAAIPYDAELLDDEADFLDRRAAALRQMASAIRMLAEPRELAA